MSKALRQISNVPDGMQPAVLVRQVETRLKQFDFAAVSITNGGESDLLVSRYLIFDHGLHRENLQINISVFTGIAEDIWGQL